MFKNHPSGLKVLFFANMGERFGYYTMLSIFTLYLQENFGWTEETTGQVYGIFMGVVYFMPLVGGFLADKIFGYGKTITWGIIIMTLGYALLAIPTKSPWFMYAALATIAIGTGAFKGNLVVLVGNLYDREKSEMRDAAFNVYYMGINIGAFFAPYAANGIKDVMVSQGFTTAVGYNMGFAISGLGMLASLLVFVFFKKHYAAVDFRSTDKSAPKSDLVLTPKQEKERIWVLIITFAVVIFFWIAFQQSGYTLTLFAKNYTVDSVDRVTYMFFNLPAFLAVIAFLGGVFYCLNRRASTTVRLIALGLALAGAGFGIYKYVNTPNSSPITAELFQAFNPIFIVFLTPLIIEVFAMLNRKGKEPSSPAKIGLGMLVTAVAFGVMVIASQGLQSVASLGGARSGAVVTPYWLIGTYFMLTLAELFLSPMGLSFVSKVAPPKLKGIMQGGWFAATAVGSLLAGLIGHFYARWELWQFFLMLVIGALASAVVVVLLLKKLKAATTS